jgi:hypothetical protein
LRRDAVASTAAICGSKLGASAWRNFVRSARCANRGWLFGKLARMRIQMLDQEFAVVRGHFAIMLPGQGIGGAVRALLERFGFLPENRRFRHGKLP